MRLFHVFMFSLLFALCIACPSGWETHGGSCYHFSRDVESWPGAVIMCQIMGGTLVEIESLQENMYLQAQIIGLHSSKYFWIALSDVVEEGSWNWMVSKTQPEFIHWASTEPNNINDEDCAWIRQTGYWSDDSCEENHHDICEKANSDTAVIG